MRALPLDLKKNLRKGLDAVERDPYAGKPLVNELDGFWTFRVLGYRIIYKFTRTEIIIVTIGPRASVYRDVLSFLKQER